VRRSLLRLSAAVVLLAVGGGIAACGNDKPELKVVDPQAKNSYDYDYVIPFGTGKRLDGGEKVQIVPGVLNAKVGQRIRIRNDDARGAAVGIFWVPAGRTVAMEFTEPGTLSGQCDVHPSGVFTINISKD
jgi:hypothetical protein